MDSDLNKPFPAPELLNANPYYDDEEDEEENLPTRYRKVSQSAVLSVVFGVLSILTVLGWFFLIIPLVGIFFALRGWQQILRAPEETTGLVLARVGLVLSAVLLIAGGSYLFHSYKHSAPPGYEKLSWEMLQPDRNKPTELVPAKVKEELDGKRVFIRGYIYPTKKIIGIRRFTLVPTEGHCQFCTTQIRPTEMVHVQTSGDMTIDYRNHMVGVGGLLRVQPKEGDLAGAVYGLEADVFRD
jgi:hypothetical protein